jgi:integrase
MTVKDAIHIFQISQQNLHRKRTTESYRYLLEHLKNHFTDSRVEGITPDQIYQFLEAFTEHMAKSTRRLRYAQVKAFFNFLINEKGIPLKNPCQDSIMVKAFKSLRMKQKDILSRESVDEIIYRSKKIRDRLILELQARCGMRIGEVLNLRASDIVSAGENVPPLSGERCPPEAGEVVDEAQISSDESCVAGWNNVMSECA